MVFEKFKTTNVYFFIGSLAILLALAVLKVFRFFINNNCVFLSWPLVSLKTLVFEIIIFVDYVRVVFSSTVIVIFLNVIYFRKNFYMSKRKNFFRFHRLVYVFVLSMLLLIFRPNLFSLILGWDGLGLRSFFLVCYYQNPNRLNSSLLTVFINRVGDSFFLVSIGRLFHIVNFNLFLLSLNYYSVTFLRVLFFILIACRTKRAQVPFSSWLPAAIAAPTPVSSLVHSSTLVTAGLYVLIRLTVVIHNYLLNFILVAGIATFHLAASRALCEIDIKKIVALSTLSQLGFIIFCIGLNYQGLAFFHLITHAFSKAFFFIITGYLIHSGQDFQDLRKGSKKNVNRSYIVYNLHLFVAIVLCGVPNFLIFFSKDYILETMIENDLYGFSVVFIYISFAYTAMYTRRLLRIILKNHMSRGLNMYFRGEFTLYSALKNSFVFTLLITGFSKLIVFLIMFEECFIVEVSRNEKNFTFALLSIGLIIGLVIDKFLKQRRIFLVFWSFRSMWFLRSRLTFYPLKTSKSLIRSSMFNIDRFFLPSIIYELSVKSVADRFSAGVLAKSKFYLVSLFLLILASIVVI